MIDGKLQVATVFSGIGAFEQALLKLNLSYTIDFLNNCSSEYSNVLEPSIFSF